MSHLPSLAPLLPTLALLSLSACTSPESTPGPAPTPEDVAAGLQPVIQLAGEPPAVYALEERMAYHSVPGVSVAVMDGGEIAWAQAWGVADTESGRPATPETLFQAASISKPVAALAALSLVDEGFVILDAPVNAFLTRWKVPENEFTADSAVTLRGTLSHTAGLTVWGFPGYRKDQPFGDQPVASNVQVLDGLGNTDPVRVYRVPGTGWQYSGGGYTVMEQMVEDVTGQPFHEAARERVLGPAGMTRSTYEQPLPLERWDEAAHGYRGDGSKVEGEWHNYPEQAAAGLWTTPSDLLRLAAHLVDIREGALHPESPGVVSAELLAEAWTAHPWGDVGESDYGLGFGVEGHGAGAPGAEASRAEGGEEALMVGHAGANEGFRAQWVFYPDLGQGAAVMTNGDRGMALANEILRSISEAYGWPGFKSEVRAVGEPSVGDLAAYAGSYAMVDDESFVLTLGPLERDLELTVPDQGSYTLYPSAEARDEFFDASDGQVVRFLRNDDDRVIGFELDNGIRFDRVEAPGQG